MNITYEDTILMGYDERYQGYCYAFWLRVTIWFSMDVLEEDRVSDLVGMFCTEFDKKRPWYTAEYLSKYIFERFGEYRRKLSEDWFEDSCEPWLRVEVQGLDYHNKKSNGPKITFEE